MQSHRKDSTELLISDLTKYYLCRSISI